MMRRNRERHVQSMRFLGRLAFAVLSSCAVGCGDDSGDRSQNIGPAASDDGGVDDAAANAGCTRDALGAAADAYLAALAARDPARLALAPNARFTENGAVLPLGQGLWQTAGAVRFQRKVLDAEQCGAVVQAVVMQGMDQAVLGVRLKLAAGQISEIETIVAGKVQDEDPAAFVPLYPDELVNTPQPEWEEPVPPEERSTRDELNRIADLYFDIFASGGTSPPPPFAATCHRWENGLQTTRNTGGCAGNGTQMSSLMISISPRRYLVADVERGVSVVFVKFANLWDDFHMFKVRGGQIQTIQAVLSSFATPDRSTGWEDQVGR